MNRSGHSRGSRVAATALVAFVLVQTLLLVFPAAYPRLLVKVLEGTSPWLDDDVTLLEVNLAGTEADFLMENRKLQQFRDRNGNPGPSAGLKYDFDLGVYNAYPLIVLTILASMPLAVRQRLRLVLVGLVFIVVVGLIDLAIIWGWMGIEGRALVFEGTGFQMAPTPENEALFLQARQGMKWITLAKSFLSTGGRQFLSVLVVGFSLLVVFPFSRTGESSAQT